MNLDLEGFPEDLLGAIAQTLADHGEQDLAGEIATELGTIVGYFADDKQDGPEEYYVNSPLEAAETHAVGGVYSLGKHVVTVYTWPIYEVGDYRHAASEEKTKHKITVDQE